MIKKIAILVLMCSVVSPLVQAQSTSLNKVRPILVFDPNADQWFVRALDRQFYPTAVGPQESAKARELNLQVRRQVKGAPLGTVTGVQQNAEGDVFVYRGAFKNTELGGDDIYMNTYAGVGIGYDSQQVYQSLPFEPRNFVSDTELRGIVGASIGYQVFECTAAELHATQQFDIVDIEKGNDTRPANEARRSQPGNLRIQLVRYVGCKKAARVDGLDQETQKLLSLQK